ncbi:hypothetical protein QJS10_CPB17g00895 [Acorus calamus]|uniref:CRM domain-containing protein n=1 Tax=Acorus calamus TaxID=4465 RepID=A0AAV9CV61_ACOCL|nr:hypothetical protein QJS10_CPB17g00895 [Acorus calamus]
MNIRIIQATLTTGPGGGPNLFSSLPPNPGLNQPLQSPPPQLPIPPPKRPPHHHQKPKPHPALKTVHRRTKYFKPISSDGGGGDGSPVISAESDGRSVVVGESGVSYLLPGAPFEFQFSYSETPKVRPLGIREPAFLPFAPPSMARPWTGKAPLKPSKKEREKMRKIKLFDPLSTGEGGGGGESGPRVLEMRRAPAQPFGRYCTDGRTREDILGKPLSRWEVKALVKPLLSHNRQINLGRDGLTHNMLGSIHSHWRRQQVCKIRCRGVPTVDMDNICRCLEEKTGGKIIHRIGGMVYLFRGRNYDYNTRPQYPVMLWKPAAPVYPKLIQEAPEGLTKEEANDLRKKGQKLLPICKLAKNGIYMNLVKDVRNAFEFSDLVKINCQGMHASDYKKLGAKLKELVPCVLLSFDEEQILMWRGKKWQSKYHGARSDNGVPSSSDAPGGTNRDGETDISSPKMMALWQGAIESSKALLLEENNLCPDALLEKVVEFEGITQATEHSYPAVVYSGEIPPNTGERGTSEDGGAEDMSGGDPHRYDRYDIDDLDEIFVNVDTSTPLGSLPVDSFMRQLGLDDL